VSYAIQKRQNGIENMCLFPGCNLKTSFIEKYYKCEAGHELNDCTTEETFSYSKIFEIFLERARFLMNLNSAVFIAESSSSKEIKTDFTQSSLSQVENLIVQAVIKFCLESDLDLNAYQYTLALTNRKAQSRIEGLKTFSSILTKVSLSTYISGSLILIFQVFG
jgi:hypothetical protein